MASIAAEQVAKEVIRSLGKSRKPVLRKIAIEKGYSAHTADTPKNITETKSYQKAIAPLVHRLVEERDAVIERLKETRNKAKYRDLIDGLDKITKNIQILTGGSTANVIIGVKKLKDDELEHIANGS